MKKLYTLTSETAVLDCPRTKQNNARLVLSARGPKESTLALLRQFARAYAPVAPFAGIVLN